MEPVARSDGEAREGLLVTVLRPNHQIGVHAAPAPPCRQRCQRGQQVWVSVTDASAQSSRREARNRLKRWQQPESIEAVSSFLDHSSLAVTSVYLRRLEGETDRTWVDVAAAIGVQ
jgi:hypothetical protein